MPVWAGIEPAISAPIGTTPFSVDLTRHAVYDQPSGVMARHIPGFVYRPGTFRYFSPIDLRRIQTGHRRSAGTRTRI